MNTAMVAPNEMFGEACPASAPFFGYMGAAAALIFASECRQMPIPARGLGTLAPASHPAHLPRGGRTWVAQARWHVQPPKQSAQALDSADLPIPLDGNSAGCLWSSVLLFVPPLRGQKSCARKADLQCRATGGFLRQRGRLLVQHACIFWHGTASSTWKVPLAGICVR